MRALLTLALLAAVAAAPQRAAGQDSARAHGDSGAAPGAPRLSEAEIADAIAWGTKAKRPYAFLTGAAAGGVGGALARTSELHLAVAIMGPYGRVATEAATAARQYRPFDRAAVSAAALEPVVVVRVEPPPPSAQQLVRGDQIRDVEHVVLLPRAPMGAPAVQPLRTDAEPLRWQNGFGATFSGTGMTAYFAADAVPPGDFDVVIIAGGKEKRYAVPRKAHALVR